MKYENGQWYMQGVPREHPDRLKNPEALLAFVDQVGFLPLFANEIDGFSVENHVCPSDWWTENAEADPWEWRGIVARNGKAAYGKFFGKKAGFVSLAWLPVLANFRRDGYDFDSRAEEGIARRRENKRGQEYGMPVTVYATPETLFGTAHITSAYREEPAVSRQRILRQIQSAFPDADPGAILRVLG